MPYNIDNTNIRMIDPQNAEQLARLAKELNHLEYLRQFPSYTLPKTIEPEFAQQAFLTWAYETIHIAYPESNFRYAVVDHTFKPMNPAGRTITVPYSYISMFDYNCLTYAGPLFLGIIPCVLQANGKGHPIENLLSSNSSLFTAKDQQRIAQQSVQAVLDYQGIAGLIIAIQNSRKYRGSRGIEDKDPVLTKAAYFHLLVGGQVLDQYQPDEFRFPEDRELPQYRDPSRKSNPFYFDNPLRSKPVSFTKLVRSDTDAYTIFPLLHGKENELLNDVVFCRLCHDIRTLGPKYQKLHPERAPGIRATVKEGLELMTELTRLGSINHKE